MPMKMEIKTPKRTKRAMMRPSLQGYLDPPHCKARRRQMMPGTKIAVPNGSNCCMRSDRLIDCFVRLAPGAVKKRVMTKRVTPPMGRLI